MDQQPPRHVDGLPSRPVEPVRIDMSTFPTVDMSMGLFVDDQEPALAAALSDAFDLFLS